MCQIEWILSTLVIYYSISFVIFAFFSDTFRINVSKEENSVCYFQPSSKPSICSDTATVACVLRNAASERLNISAGAS